ncbi:MAG: hypothetical protein N2485_00485 [bacterium]|nr:hypothetical protein [bacterium]
MYQDIDYYLKSIFYERPDNPAKLLSDLFKIQNITDIKVIKIKEQHPKIIIPDFVIKFKIENQYYLLNIEFQTKLNKESVLKAVMYNILIKQEYKLPVLSMILSIDKRYSRSRGVFYYKVKEGLKIENKKGIDFIKIEVMVINLLNEEIREIVRKRDYLGLIELIESYTSDYDVRKLEELIELVEERTKRGIYKEKEEILLKIIIGLMYLRRTKVSKEEILRMLRIDKKEKEKIKRMYKDNPLIQYIAETIFEDELKKYQEKLKQKEIEAKQKEEELKQKEEELKELKIKALKETVNSLIKVKLRKKWLEFITKIERINDEHKLIKLKEILEYDYKKFYFIVLSKKINIGSLNLIYKKDYYFSWFKSSVFFYESI